MSKPNKRQRSATIRVLVAALLAATTYGIPSVDADEGSPHLTRLAHQTADFGAPRRLQPVLDFVPQAAFESFWDRLR